MVFSWIFIYEDILWYLLYKEWMSLTVSPEHYLPGHLLKHFLHVHGIILSIVHVKVILRKIENCCDYSCLWTLQLPDQICNSPYCQPYSSYNVSSEDLVLDQLTISKLIIFLYSHDLFGLYCTDILRRNSVLVTHGS